MNVEVWEPADITNEALRELFETAYMALPVADDDRGWIIVSSNGVRLRVEAGEDGKSIKYTSYYHFKDTTSELQRLKFANEINSNYSLIRANAYLDTCIVDYQIQTNEGVSKNSVVRSCQFFAGICNIAIHDDPENFIG